MDRLNELKRGAAAPDDVSIHVEGDSGKLIFVLAFRIKTPHLLLLLLGMVNFLLSSTVSFM